MESIPWASSAGYQALSDGREGEYCWMMKGRKEREMKR